VLPRWSATLSARGRERRRSRRLLRRSLTRRTAVRSPAAGRCRPAPSACGWSKSRVDLRAPLLPAILPDLVEDDAVVFSFNDSQPEARRRRPGTPLCCRRDRGTHRCVGTLSSPTYHEGLRWRGTAVELVVIHAADRTRPGVRAWPLSRMSTVNAERALAATESGAPSSWTGP
jgi:hypothetical protein